MSDFPASRGPDDGPGEHGLRLRPVEPDGAGDIHQSRGLGRDLLPSRLGQHPGVGVAAGLEEESGESPGELPVHDDARDRVDRRGRRKPERFIGTDPDIGEEGGALPEEGDRAFAQAVLEVVDFEAGRLGSADEHPGLTAGDFDPDGDPFVEGKLEGIRESLSVIKLPSGQAVEDRRVLDGIRVEAGAMGADVETFGLVAGPHPEQDPRVGPASGQTDVRGPDVELDDPVLEDDVLEHGKTGHGLAPGLLHDPGVVQNPISGLQRNGLVLREAGKRPEQEKESRGGEPVPACLHRRPPLSAL